MRQMPSESRRAASCGGTASRATEGDGDARFSWRLRPVDIELMATRPPVVGNRGYATRVPTQVSASKHRRTTFAGVRLIKIIVSNKFPSGGKKFKVSRSSAFLIFRKNRRVII